LINQEVIFIIIELLRCEKRCAGRSIQYRRRDLHKIGAERVINKFLIMIISLPSHCRKSIGGNTHRVKRRTKHHNFKEKYLLKHMLGIIYKECGKFLE
jgi:hypothetical protein